MTTVVQQNLYTTPTAADFGDETTISEVDEKGRPVKFVLLTDGRIARIREGKGKDVEQATMISNGNQSKYLSAMMSSTIEINDKPLVMEDLADLLMKDYMRLQVSFAEINF
jgi:hypothetical protein